MRLRAGRLAKRLSSVLREPKIRPFFWFVLFLLLSGVFMVVLERGVNPQFLDFFDGLWWSVITFSTTGYGDKVPATTGGKVLAIFTVLFGIGITTFLSGTLASFLVDRNTKARRGLMDFRKLRNHLVVCGWKDDMAEILGDILALPGGFEADRIVVVSNMEPEKVEAVKGPGCLRDVKFVRGDYFSEPSLDRAGVRNARKVLVLADTLESAAPSEVDSKTVMTVLTVKALARDVYVCAEILDKKYESYLRHAGCDEILFSRDFSRRILANTSATNGMSHIILELLSRDRGSSRLSTCDIPAEFSGRAFRDYRAAFGAGAGRLLLGILENTGSPNRMKMESLREAQKTSDVSQLISNLQKVKELEVNKPVLLPGDDYTIQKHSLAIVLEKAE